MIEKLIEASIRNRFLVMFVTAALAAVGVYAVVSTPMDAIPDLSENQVIVFTDWPGRSPKEIEDQVAYALSRKLQGLAGIRAVRASSEFNFSMITLIFDDSINFYFARQRVAEKLAEAVNYLPKGVVPYLAPDTTALGQIFYYTVEPSAAHPLDPAKLWALNKFYIVPQLNAARGVADVAVLGGLPLEYQIDVRPEALRAWGVTLGELYDAVARSNLAVGGGVIQKNYSEYLVRGVGWIQGVRDIENIVIKEAGGVPVYVKNLAIVQLGTQFRRGVFEKDGSEVTGGIVMMRHGENPLAVTLRIKEKIQELQPGLPAGVRIVPAYDRTRLIHGAIETLAGVMWHEMVIASIAILLILMHVRSVFVICVTLPLAVLFSFLLMFVLRKLGILDVQANIMSLAGITISIGILVDQAIVMTDNATHHLKEHFGDRKVTGDTREIVIPACRTVGRPIFFSVLIMLLSFVPVFLLQGREGKLFHPLAFTKSFALIGVALISVTVVPALIPTFIKGRIRSEEENWLVRTATAIYKPLLTWALPRRNLVMWLFSVLLILFAGLFPLQAVVGFGASEWAWRICFLVVFGVVVFVTVMLTRGLISQALSLASLVLIGLWAFHFPKIGVTFMPALDEGTTLDMPVSWPRIGITQAADDLKHRDGLLRGFPEVESVIGKAGRADTPTDPAPLEMFETLVNFRPKALWPERVLKFDDAALQSRAILTALEDNGFVLPSRGMSGANPADQTRDELINDATQKALERFDENMRELALLRYRKFERELGPQLTRFGVDQAMKFMLRKRALPPEATREQLVQKLTPDFGSALAKHPALEDTTHLAKQVAGFLVEESVIGDAARALEWRQNTAGRISSYLAELFGIRKQTLPGALLDAIETERTRLWHERVKRVNAELFERGTEAYTWYALEELPRAAGAQGLVTTAPQGSATHRFIQEARKAQLNYDPDAAAFAPFEKLRQELEKPFRERVFFWPRTSGPKGNLVDDEMSRVLQVPGWSNIFTQPIINRIEMLSTGIRTDVGIKVFGADPEAIDRICKEIEQAVKPVTGARDAVASPLVGRGYLEINIQREKAARYGISVENVQNEIEVALGGRVVTYTVEKRERFPVRVRYARASREDEESIKRLLIAPAGMAKPVPMSVGMASESAGGKPPPPPGGSEAHQASSSHAARRALIPLATVADVRIVEGPALIRSENGRLYNFVTLNVRGRDMVGFVEEAKRVVAEKVTLPEGTHIEWSGEFEHQERAAKTLLLIFPIVALLIFVILYLTYNDFADAILMFLAVPEALAGGAFFMYLFPKIMHGWDTPPMDFSVAVWVGFIACFGMATETGIIMLVYLREAIAKRGGLENIQSLEELRQAVIEGAVHRLRPKLLTEGVAIVAIFPMVFATGVGGEILAPMALPVLGGLLISDEVVDLFLPVRFYWVRRTRWLKIHGKTQTGTLIGTNPH